MFTCALRSFISTIIVLTLLLPQVSAVTAFSSPTYGSVELQACSTNNCTNGTCHTRITAGENVCFNEFFSGISQKFKCIYQGNSSQRTGEQNLCISERYWYNKEIAACDNKKPHAFAHAPCNRCSQTSSYKFAMLSGCENGLILNSSGYVKFSYNCEFADCSRCANTMMIPTRQCVWRGDRMFSIDDVYPCPTIIEMNNYKGFGCETQSGPAFWLVPGEGPRACYSDVSNYGTQLICQEKPPVASENANRRAHQQHKQEANDPYMDIKDEDDRKLLKFLREEKSNLKSSSLFV